MTERVAKMSVTPISWLAKVMRPVCLAAFCFNQVVNETDADGIQS